MHAKILAELACWVSTHSAPLVFGEQEQPEMAAQSYWTATQCRLNRWCSALRMFEKDLELQDERHNPWPAIEIVVQEIIVSELLTRVWSATMVMHDQVNETDELHGIAHGVHVGHIEAKNRALRIMLRGRAKNEEAFDRMNFLRRRIERWTDLFLSQLPLIDSAATFAFDESRVRDFGRENAEYASHESQTRRQILMASLDTDLERSTQPSPANPDLNRQVAAGVLACFPSDRFDSTGLPKSAQTIWLEKSHNDTALLLDHLTQLEDWVDDQPLSVFHRN